MRLRTLGGLELEGSGFTRPKPLLLLAYVAVEGPRGRRHLAELLWAEATDPLKSLSVALAQLRSGAPGAIEADRSHVHTTVETDAVQLLDALATRRSSQAVGLYRGAFLTGLPLSNLGVEIEEWIYRTREMLAGRIRREILTLAAADAAATDFQQAARRAEIAWRLEGASLPEDDALLQIHRLLLAGGSPLEPEIRSELEELGLEARSPDLQSARNRLRKEDSPTQNNLPARRTSFVGREELLVRAAEAVRTAEGRLVTLRGPAGVGKTRLALEIARTLLQEGSFPGGVHFVGLASVRKPDDVASNITDALGLFGRTTRSPRDELVAHLRNRAALLVLDNFEHLLDAAGLVADLLEACPGLTVLATSRVPLRLRGEQELLVAPLLVPDLDEDEQESIERAPSIRLFLERARTLRPELKVGASTVSAIAEICRRLDGLPLAIELAASRVRMFEPEALAQRIRGRLDLPGAAGHDYPERHRTLREAIAWGHDLLRSEEQHLFRRLGVFEGGFDLETVIGLERRLANDEREARAGRTEVLRVVESLVEGSFLQVESTGSGTSRLHQLETVREFALERLAESGEVYSVQRAHAEEMRELARRTASQAVGPEQARWLTHLRRERGNLEAALDWAETRRETEIALGIANAVWRLWLVTDPLPRGIERMQRLLRLPESSGDERERARASNVLGTLSHELGELPGAKAALEQSLAIWRRYDETEEVAIVLNNLSWTDLLRGDVGPARRWAGEAARIYQQAEDLRGVAVALNNLGWIAHLRGRFPQAADLHRRSLELRIRAGDERGVAYAKENLAWAEVQRGRPHEAERLTTEALEVLEALGDEQLIAWGQFVLGLVKIVKASPEEALRLLARSITSWRRVGNRVGLAWALAARGRALVAAGRPREAIEPLDEAIDTCRAIGSPWTLIDALPQRAATSFGGLDDADASRWTQEAERLAVRHAAIERFRAACETVGLSYSSLGPR